MIRSLLHRSSGMSVGFPCDFASSSMYSIMILLSAIARGGFVSFNRSPGTNPRGLTSSRSAGFL
jgi:hypothetical protein